MVKFKNFRFSKKFLLRYLGISLISYLYTLLGLLLLVEVLYLDELISFILVYGSAYVILYGVQLKYLFNKEHNSKKLLRYLFSIIGFYIAANLIYYIAILLDFPYIISAILGIGVIIPVRIIVYKFYVYRD